MNASVSVSLLCLVIFCVFQVTSSSADGQQACLLNERQKVLSFDGIEHDSFGVAVSIDDDLLIVGTHNSFGDGSVYLYRRDENDTPSDPNDDVWVDEAKLVASDSPLHANFGRRSVSGSGDWVIVGASGVIGGGAAYMFRHDDNGSPADTSDDSWIEHAILTASDGGRSFGFSVSIDGDWAIVGSKDDEDGGYRAGAAYLFRRDDNGSSTDISDDTWIEVQKIRASDENAGALFGFSVDISGDHAVIGASKDDFAGLATGSAYVFGRDDNGTPKDASDDLWHQEAKLTASDAIEYASFGRSVAISGALVAVGSPFVDFVGACISGWAYIYRHDDGDTPADPRDDQWVEIAKLLPSDWEPDDCFGSPVAIYGDRVVVGISGWGPDHGKVPGQAYVFRQYDNGTVLDLDDDSWVQEAKLLASDAATNLSFASSIAISGNSIVGGAVGDNHEGDGFGAAYIFSLNDADGDAVPNECDICRGGDDRVDSDGDGVANSCDRCPFDDPDDSDADGVCDSADQCPGEDDRIDEDMDGTPDCAQLEGIPAVTVWGLVILTLMLLALGKLQTWTPVE